MTVSVNLWSEEGTSTVDNDGRIVSTYTQVYLVKSNVSTRPYFDAFPAILGIYPGSPFYEDTNATCRRIHVGPFTEKTRSPYLKWLCEVEWSTDATLNAGSTTDPTTRRTLLKIRPIIQQRFVIRDSSNNLIVNTAGQPYDGGIPVDVRLGQVTASRNVTAAGYDKAAVLANSGKLNSVTFLGGAPGTVQVDIEAEEHYEGAYHFWSELYTFTYDPLGHQPKPASAGFFQRSAAGSNILKRITNQDLDASADTTPILEPEPLDSSGLLVPIASRPGSCAFVNVSYFGTMDFSTFGL